MSHDKIIAIQPFRNLYYLNFKNTAIQRWAARQVKNENYYALSPTLWRKMGFRQLPQGIVGEKPSPGFTMYFEREEHAAVARDQCIEALTEAGVLR